ncbi:hypothetical protein CfE428DRAFT_1812 [Chthoniobacter flavus Ellin428]|uniref:DUF4412 domain-containing protein n=1 Tax=Chthoniobacter flavus Ellin428 TaxID=497964 RepID=B4CYS4_9BACT|nr:hypothetical protein [Chthoniobacter flavus]EDY20615.1 hypothetical protein CfE428DRAFT_1812 [Chthoniobacter flavus Ellin428]TCO89878.1 hypothetical protein EV701_11250 [Chthoniobacter flavus]
MKTFPAFCLALVVTVTLHAQQAAPAPSLPALPPGPLLKRAPDYSTWTVTCQGHPIEGREPVKAATTGEEKPKDKEGKEPVIMASTVVKAGSTILELSTDTGGKRTEIWHVGGLMVMKRSDDAEPSVWPDSVQADIYSVNFAVADFAGLDWISPTTYTGMAKYQGRDCIQFKGDVSPLNPKAREEEAIAIGQAIAFGQPAPQEVKVAAVAYIDLETRLPLFVTFGKEKRIYQYGTPPTAELTLPAELASAVKEREKQMKRLSTRPAKAY